MKRQNRCKGNTVPFAVARCPFLYSDVRVHITFGRVAVKLIAVNNSGFIYASASEQKRDLDRQLFYLRLEDGRLAEVSTGIGDPSYGKEDLYLSVQFFKEYESNFYNKYRITHHKNTCILQGHFKTPFILRNGKFKPLLPPRTDLYGFEEVIFLKKWSLERGVEDVILD